MEAVARKQISQLASEVSLTQVRACKVIVIFDDTKSESTVINPGEVFWVNMIPMEGIKGFGARFRGENFFVQIDEFKALYN